MLDANQAIGQAGFEKPAWTVVNGVPTSGNVVWRKGVTHRLRFLSMTLDELLSPRRSARIARARQLAMYLARELTPLSLTEIARGFSRDHTTVLHAIRSVSARLEPGSETAESIHRIRATLGRERTTRDLKPTDSAPPPQPNR